MSSRVFNGSDSQEFLVLIDQNAMQMLAAQIAANIIEQLGEDQEVSIDKGTALILKSSLGWSIHGLIRCMRHQADFLYSLCETEVKANAIVFDKDTARLVVKALQLWQYFKTTACKREEFRHSFDPTSQARDWTDLVPPLLEKIG